MYSKIVKKELGLDFILGALFCVIIGGFFILPTSPHRIVLYGVFIVGALFIRRENDWSYVLDFKSGNKVFLCALAFLFYACLSNLWSEITEFDRLFQQIKPALFIPLFMIICASFLKNRMQVLSLWVEVYILCAVVTALILILMDISAIYDAYFVEPTKWRIRGLGRADNPNQAGMFYGVALLNLFFLKPVYIKIFKNKFFKAFCAFCILAMFFLTLSRGAFMAFCMTSVVLAFINGCLSGVNVKLLALPLFVAALLSAIVIFIFPHLFIYMVERGTTGRLDLWQAAFQQFLQSPIFGHGAGTKFYYDVALPNSVFTAGHVHNLYLSVLVHFGLVGFALFLSLLALTFAGLLKYIKDTGDYSWMIFFVYSCFFGFIDLGGHYNSLSSSWMVFWIPISVLIAYQKKKAA